MAEEEELPMEGVARLAVTFTAVVAPPPPKEDADEPAKVRRRTRRPTEALPRDPSRELIPPSPRPPAQDEPAAETAETAVDEPAPEEEKKGAEEGAEEGAEDPPTASMTVAYALPDGTEFVSTHDDHPLVVARRAAGVVPCDSWTGPTHELVVNEDTVRTMARTGARLVVTFTRSNTGGEAGDDDEGGAKSDVASTTIELASLVLGSESFAERVYDADAVDGEAFSPAFAGYRRVRVGVRLVEAPAEDAAGDDDARPATSTPPPFLPAGLARDLRPFAVTLHRASNLPDAPASHAALDELCEPIGAHLAWRHPKTKESVWPKTDDDDDDAAAARVVSWRTASSTTPWRTVVPLESFSAPFMTRDARFDSSLMFMAKDMPTDLHDACASAPLELRIHDRVVRAVPEKFPGLDKLEGKDDGSGEGAEGAEGGGTNAKGSFDADGFPVAAAYAKAVFDLRSACEWPRTRTKFRVEANLEPVSAVPGGAGASLDWTCRAGRYVEAHATVTMTFETCAPLRDPRAPPTPAKTIDVDAKEGAEGEGAEAPAAEGEGAEGEGAEVPPTPPDPRPFRRCVFAMHYSNVPLFREILDVVRRRNAKTLEVDGTPAHVLFELAHARFEPAQIADPSFAVVTGFHVIDGVTRLILIEGTAGEVMDPMYEIASREASNPGVRVLFNRRLGYDARMYGDLGGDIWPVKLCETVPALAKSPAVLAGDGVRPITRECVLKLAQLLDARAGPSWMREVESSRAFPRVEGLVSLDKRFGAELTVTDLTGEAPRLRGVHRTTRTDADDELEAYAGGSKGGRARDVERAVERNVGQTVGRDDAAAVTSPGTARGKARRRVHPPLDMTTPLDGSYLTDLAARRRARTRRDLTADYLAHTERLQRTLGDEKRRAWREWNVRRITAEEDAEIKAKEAEMAAKEAEMAAAAEEAAARGRSVKPLHPAPFKWPVAPTYAGDHVHPKHPGERRAAELREPWEAPTIDFDVTMHCPEKWKVPSPTNKPRGPHFDKIPAPVDRLFETNPAFFNSVHLYGEDLIKEKKDAVVKARKEWRAKCVVDNPGTMEYHGMKVTLPSKDYAAIPAADRYRSILHDPPVKLGLTGKRVKGAEHPPPVSMFTHEDLEVTNPHSKLNALTLREIDKTKFTAGSGVDFKRHNLVAAGGVHTGTLDLVGAEDDEGNKPARYRRDRSVRRG